MAEIREQKKSIREKIKAERAQLDRSEKERLDAALCGRFTSLASYRYARTIFLYAPTDDEIDIMPIARAAWRDGKTVAFPICRPEDKAMIFRAVEREEDLAPRHFDIREPDDSAPEVDPANCGTAVCVVPALAFDREGFRVGYGGGYYDRFLSRFLGSKIGLIYSKFVSVRVPRGRFDTAVDALVTEKGVIPCQTKK